jgi:hypothetical protein
VRRQRRKFGQRPWLDTTPLIPNSSAKFHAYYIWSENRGSTFLTENQRLLYKTVDNPSIDPPAVTFGTAEGISLSDYVGLAVRDPNPSQPGFELWTSYAGAEGDNDPVTNNTMFWSSRIIWTDN